MKNTYIRHHLLHYIVCALLFSLPQLSNAQNFEIDSLSTDLDLYEALYTHNNVGARYTIVKIDELLNKLPNNNTHDDLTLRKVDYYENLGQFSDAIATCTEMLNNRPSPEYSTVLYIRLSNLYSRIGGHEESIKFAKQALEVSPNTGYVLMAKIALRDALSNNPEANNGELIDLCFDIISPQDDSVRLRICSEYLNTLDCIASCCEIPSKELDKVKSQYQIIADTPDTIPNFSMRALLTLFAIKEWESGEDDVSYLKEACEQYKDYIQNELNSKKRIYLGTRGIEVVEWYLKAKIKLADLSEDVEESMRHVGDLLAFFRHNLESSEEKSPADDYEAAISSIPSISHNFYRQVLEQELYWNIRGEKTPDDLYTIFDITNELLQEGMEEIKQDLGHLTKLERSLYLQEYDECISDALYYSMNNIDIHGKFRKNAFDICTFYQGLLLATEQQFIKGKLKDADTTAVVNYSYDEVYSRLNETKDNALYVNFVRNERFRGNVEYGAYVFNKDMEYPQFIELCSEEDLQNLIQRKYAIYKDTRAYSLIFGGIDDYIAKYDTIVIIPDGLLNSINFEALKVTGGKCFYQSKNIRRISTIRGIFSNQQNIWPNYAVLFGGLQYFVTDDEYEKARKSAPSPVHGFRSAYSSTYQDRSEIQYLKGTKAEVDILSQMFKKHRINYKKYTGIYGSEEVFKGLSGEKIPILHVATHGFYYNERELRKAAYLDNVTNSSTYNTYESGLLHSGLILSGGGPAFNGDRDDNRQEDGVLLGEEIASVDLSQTDLVVLSACETGLGDATAEGLIGLQRAFKKAGAKTLILTLWPVNDECTRDFMIAFYRNILSGEDKHSAFYNAIDLIKTKETYLNPEYWAPFIMVD